jgi:hypothetical protein
MSRLRRALVGAALALICLAALLFVFDRLAEVVR